MLTKKNTKKQATKTTAKTNSAKKTGGIDINFHIDEPAIETAKSWASVSNSCNQGGFTYFLAFLGAAIYYIGQATTFGTGFVGFLKAMIWPLFLVMELLKFIAA